MADHSPKSPSGLFVPSPEIAHKSRVPDYEGLHARAVADPRSFWEERARLLSFSHPHHTLLDWNPETFEGRWLVGAQGNIVDNALDRHVAEGHGTKVALIWSGDGGEEKVFTYAELLEKTIRFAQALRSQGVGKGDRVAIFLPPTPDQVVAMLACARLGAIHAVVFSGFSQAALRSRLEDFEPKVLVTADLAFRRGKRVPLLDTARKAREEAGSVTSLIIVGREGAFAGELRSGEHRLEDLLARLRHETPLPPEPMGADDPLFVLYTSGTTGKPKGIVHMHLGYMLGTFATTREIFDIRDSDVYFCVADPGWITGHSYVVYGPLLNRATVLLAEGTPEYPDAGRHWSLIERHRVSIYYSPPTTIRLLMRQGDEWPAKFDLRSLRILGSVGEPLNPEACTGFTGSPGATFPFSTPGGRPRPE